MQPKVFSILGGCLVCLGFLAACDRPIRGTDEPLRRVNRGGCFESQLVAPQILADQGGYVDTLRPEFHFSYPESCDPGPCFKVRTPALRTAGTKSDFEFFQILRYDFRRRV